ncbi:MAG: signal peptidase II [Candidatus Omnitrophota bacterium]|nr:signal peptidase II [Candidatus Omnitrophota bacterium]MBU1894310.1 signal peptidase II [Candidatus Omnitrophota bacterium]
MPGKKRKIFGTIVFYYICSLIICFLDQASKACVKMLVAEGVSIPVVGRVVHITLVHNRGSAFGMFKGCSYLFAGITFGVVILISYFLAAKNKALNVYEKISLCFILGGACGNLIDRIRYGYVVDFIDFRVWPVFNLADSFITSGAVILIFSMFFKKER